jgi:hypothetical protein
MQRVLTWKASGDGDKLIWIAQAIDEDICSQGPWELDDPMPAIEDLGNMFDARDHFLREHAEDRIEPVPPAPQEFIDAWETGEAFGQFEFGIKRRCDVRKCRDGVDPYLTWKGNRAREKA